MKNVALSILALLLLAFPAQVLAHSGRTDSNGGHNCNVGACAGTYHYHTGSSYTPPPRQPVVTTKNITETEAVPFQTEEQNNSELANGQRQVTQEGVNGLRTNMYKIIYTDGVQTNKQLLTSTITKRPVNKIIDVGIRAESATVAGASSSRVLDSNESSSPGEALGGLAILGGLGYGVFRLGKFSLAKIRR